MAENNLRLSNFSTVTLARLSCLHKKTKLLYCCIINGDIFGHVYGLNLFYFRSLCNYFPLQVCLSKMSVKKFYNWRSIKRDEALVLFNLMFDF